MSFYSNFLALCNSVNKTPSRVVLEVGLKKSAVTRWKAGSLPTDASAQKVADYFCITIDELMAENENKPTIDGELTEMQIEAVELIKSMSEDQLRVFIATAKAMMGE